MPTPLVEAVTGCLEDFGGDLLTCPGVERRGEEAELDGEAGVRGEAFTSDASVSFVGVAKRGASHISTSVVLSESPNETPSSCSPRRVEVSLVGTALSLLELSHGNVPSPHSDCVDSARSAFLDVSPLDTWPVSSPGGLKEEAEGTSMSAVFSEGASTVDRLASGCSATCVLAFLFPRSRRESEGLLNNESNLNC